MDSSRNALLQFSRAVFSLHEEAPLLSSRFTRRHARVWHQQWNFGLHFQDALPGECAPAPVRQQATSNAAANRPTDSTGLISRGDLHRKIMRPGYALVTGASRGL